MANKTISRNFVKWEVDFCKELTEIDHNPEHFTGLIQVAGLHNVLQFIEKSYLEKNRVDLRLFENTEDIAMIDDLN